MSTDLPPEAYTRETLQKAFDWLQEQPEPVRASVHTPERLVSLFRKSLRESDNPVSSRQFVTDLKNLASQFNEFDGRPQILEPQNKAMFDFSTPSENKDLPPPPWVTPPPQQTTTVTETKKASFEVTTKSEQSIPAGLHLDPVSLEKVADVKKRFNLSSDSEALRLIISLGFEKFSEFQ